MSKINDGWLDITSSLERNEFEAGVRSVAIPDWECGECGYRCINKREGAKRVSGAYYIKHFIKPVHSSACSHYEK